MKWIKPTVLALILAVAAPATAQEAQPDFRIVAQAYDRCMATYAVRLTRTAASDGEIFSQASQGCLALKDRLRAAINAQLPPAQAGEILQAIDAQGEPNFMAMLRRIRSDRARRGDR
jgi:hypothetical protein